MKTIIFKINYEKIYRGLITYLMTKKELTMGNVRLKKRLKRKNTKDRKVYYWPRAVSHHKNLDPGTLVICLEDAYGVMPKLVKVARFKDYDYQMLHKQDIETYIVFLEDLTE